MKTAYQRIEGHERVVQAFGHWPTFHDAEVLSLLLDRTSALFNEVADARLDVCLHAFDWTRTAKPELNHHLVQFRFHEIDELTLDGFNHQNALFEFRIEDHSRGNNLSVGFKLTFAAAHGLSGSFCAVRAEVLSVVPCDSKN